MKCRSRNLDVYNNKFTLGTTRRLRKSLWDQKIFEKYLLNINQEQAYCINILDVDELKWRISNEWAPLSRTVTECADGDLASASIRACVRTAGEHFEHIGYCNKDDVVWDVWLFLRQNNCQSCCYSDKSFKCTLSYCVDGSIWHFKFPKVMQAHTLGEVDNLDTFC